MSSRRAAFFVALFLTLAVYCLLAAFLAGQEAGPGGPGARETVRFLLVVAAGGFGLCAAAFGAALYTLALEESARSDDVAREDSTTRA